MATELKLPPVSEGVESVDIAEILVAEGDVIEEGQIVAEVETDKAVAEVPAEQGGKVTKIHYAAGDTVEVGATLITLEAADGAAPTSSSADGAAPTSSSADKPEPKAEEKPTESEPKDEAKQESTPEPAQEQKPAAQLPATTQPADSGDGRPPAPAGPATRRLARELGVDLHQVKGTGPGGRITQEDVQEFVKGILSGQSTALATTGGGGGLAPPPLPDFSKFGVVKREKLNKLSRTAAENLTVSWNVIPHVTQHDLTDITDIEAARRQFMQGPGKEGPKVTMTAVAIKAVAAALKSFPKFNSSLDPLTMEIVYKEYINVGCAVDTPNGLVVPVIKDADLKSIVEIAADVTELAVKARDRKLSMDEMQGATFTITNLGGIGGSSFTPIVNYPEVAILGMSRGQKQLRMVDGSPQERMMLPLSLSYDHRVINGADAARFIVKLSSLLADPFTLLTQC